MAAEWNKKRLEKWKQSRNRIQHYAARSQTLCLKKRQGVVRILNTRCHSGNLFFTKVVHEPAGPELRDGPSLLDDQLEAASGLTELLCNNKVMKDALQEASSFFKVRIALPEKVGNSPASVQLGLLVKIPMARLGATRLLVEFGQ